MSTRRMAMLVSAFALASTSCQPPPQEVSGLSDDDVAAIRSVLDAVIEADLAGDWARAASFAAEDFVYMPPNGSLIEGRAAWQEWIESLNLTVTDVVLKRVEIDGRGDLAHLWGVYSETLMFEGAAEPIHEVGKFVWILEKQPDGSWLLALSISNSDLPLPGEGTQTGT